MTQEQVAEIQKAIRQGLRSLERPEPLKLSEWAEENFYLSAESSYVEGRWETIPYQRAIMNCISNDDIREINWIKSARTGYTKIIVAAVGYFAEHKRRNQVIFQPVDQDAEDFVKDEIDPMLRDVPAVQRVFPWYNTKSKHNTLGKKVFMGSTLDIRGGRAAKNYRRLSKDIAYYDELDGFDPDIEHEGDPVTLGDKRIEGATFPKSIRGSTPKTKGSSLIEYRAEQAEHFFRYHVPCPHCDHSQHLQFGGADAHFGFKWVGDDPKTVQYLCESCGALFGYEKYLELGLPNGVWKDPVSGVWIDPDDYFRNAQGEIIDTPVSVAFHLWTAYSVMTTWAQITKEFLAARKDRSKLKTWVNTTLGETWEEDEVQKSDPDILYQRREHYPAEVPQQVAAITFGVDTQDDRFEIQFDGWGSGEERWSIDFIRLFGDPSRPDIWVKLGECLRRQFRREDGAMMGALLGTMDHGGHYSDEVNQFSRRMGIRWLIPIKGSSQYGKPVAIFPRKRNAKGVYLTEVGTDTAKELLFQRLHIFEPGPGYWHWPIKDAFDETYFRQLTAEERIKKYNKGIPLYVWDAKGRRQEPWDCSVYSLAAVRILQQHMGLKLETPPPAPKPTEHPKPAAKSAGDWIQTNGDWI